MIKITNIHTEYVPKEVAIGIVHIGLGAFHRAHQAVYVEKNLNRHSGGKWGICAVNIRSNSELVDQLNQHNGQYHIAEYSDNRNVHIREVNSIREALFAGQDKQALFTRLLSPDTKIVTLTVTEKGYYVTPADKKLRRDDPDILHDIEFPQTPKTTPGILVEALYRRKQQGEKPFTVLSCDNMPNNGAIIQQAVYELALLRSPEFAQWILTDVAFPCSMVDRIVPAMTNASKARLKQELNCSDPNALMCETFSQWVVEDKFPQGRPDWELDGVQMVDAVHPFETMKLRLLNGSHSLLAYIGFAANHLTVSDAMNDQRFVELVQHYMEQVAAPTLDLPDDVNVGQYISGLVLRFSNDSLQHQLMQIASDGSQKIPQRWLGVAEHALEKKQDISTIALGIAAWIQYVSGHSLAGQQHDVVDPMAAQLKALHGKSKSAEDLITSILSLQDIFPHSLAKNPQFFHSVLIAYLTLTSKGVAAALQLVHHNSTQTGA